MAKELIICWNWINFSLLKKNLPSKMIVKKYKNRITCKLEKKEYYIEIYYGNGILEKKFNVRRKSELTNNEYKIVNYLIKKHKPEILTTTATGGVVDTLFSNNYIGDILNIKNIISKESNYYLNKKTIFKNKYGNAIITPSFEIVKLKPKQIQSLNLKFPIIYFTNNSRIQKWNLKSIKSVNILCGITDIDTTNPKKGIKDFTFNNYSVNFKIICKFIDRWNKICNLGINILAKV